MLPLFPRAGPSSEPEFTEGEPEDGALKPARLAFWPGACVGRCGPRRGAGAPPRQPLLGATETLPGGVLLPWPLCLRRIATSGPCPLPSLRPNLWAPGVASPVPYSWGLRTLWSPRQLPRARQRPSPRPRSLWHRRCFEEQLPPSLFYALPEEGSSELPVSRESKGKGLRVRVWVFCLRLTLNGPDPLFSPAHGFAVSSCRAVKNCTQSVISSRLRSEGWEF